MFDQMAKQMETMKELCTQSVGGQEFCSRSPVPVESHGAQGHEASGSWKNKGASNHGLVTNARYKLVPGPKHYDKREENQKCRKQPLPQSFLPKSQSRQVARSRSPIQRTSQSWRRKVSRSRSPIQRNIQSCRRKVSRSRSPIQRNYQPVNSQKGAGRRRCDKRWRERMEKREEKEMATQTKSNQMENVPAQRVPSPSDDESDATHSH